MADVGFGHIETGLRMAKRSNGTIRKSLEGEAICVCTCACVHACPLLSSPWFVPSVVQDCLPITADPFGASEEQSRDLNIACQLKVQPTVHSGAAFPPSRCVRAVSPHLQVLLIRLAVAGLALILAPGSGNWNDPCATSNLGGARPGEYSLLSRTFKRYRCTLHNPPSIWWCTQADRKITTTPWPSSILWPEISLRAVTVGPCWVMGHGYFLPLPALLRPTLGLPSLAHIPTTGLLGKSHSCELLDNRRGGQLVFSLNVALI